MKKHIFFAETIIFFVVFFLFICPSVFQNRTEINDFVLWNFPAVQLVYFLFSIFLLFVYLKENEMKVVKGAKFQKPSNYVVSLFSIILLFVTSLIFQFVGAALNFKDNSIQLKMPETIIQAVFCILTFVFSGAFEEVTFRFLVPEILIKIPRELKENLPFQIDYFCEVFAAILFGLCHRYLGLLAIINAVAAHFVLRWTYKKTECLLFSFLSHFIYNLLNVIILANF